jgi:WD repeat and SOF domain-containing protein 1
LSNIKNMKVKAINRSPDEWARERAQDLRKVHRNLDPVLHPFEKAVEVRRALSAVKLAKGVFAKPFMAALALDDAVTCLARSPARLNALVAGCADGTLSAWDVAGRRRLRRFVGHSAGVTGVAVAPAGDALVSTSSDGTARVYALPFAPPAGHGAVDADAPALLEFAVPAGGTGAAGLAARSGGAGAALRGVDHHPTRAAFATAGAAVHLWDHARAAPVRTLVWGADGVTAVRYSPAEPDLLAGCGGDRSITLYDVRLAAPVRKVVMQTRANAVSWNPMEPLNFTCASEDACCYTFDLRHLDAAACVHKDFVSAVMDVDWSPTGREFVAGGYDRTVRLFAAGAGHAREVYHATRMQRVFAARFSGDGAYVFSGSDDMNVRLWKADAAAQLGTLLPREKHKQAYDKALVARYRHLPEVGRIAREVRLPKAVMKAAKAARASADADTRKLRRRVSHSAPGSVEVKPARRKKIVAEVE